MAIRDRLPLFISHTIRYLVTMFPAAQFIITNELVITGFSFADPKKFNDFYSFCLNFHALLLAAVVLEYLFYPFLSKVLKFKPVPRKGHRVNTFNVPQRTLSIVAIISLMSFEKYKYFSIGLGTIVFLIYFIDLQNDFLQCLISFALGVGIYFCNLIYSDYFRLAVIIISSVISSLYITKMIKLGDMDPKARNTYVGTVIQNLGFLFFDAIIRLAKRTNAVLVFVAFLTNFAIHVIAQYSISGNWYGESKKDKNK
jgi:hypothetical protein